MGRIIQPARNPGSGVGAPNILSGAYTTGQTFKKGALLKYVSGELQECAADPTKVAGVALEPAGSKPGYDAANSPTVVTGRVQEVSFAKSDRTTVFSMRGKSAGGGDPLTPTQAHIGVQYGVVKVSNDWVLDIDEVTTKVFQVVDVDIDNKIFFCVFLDTVIET